MKSIFVSRCLLGEAVRYDGGHCSICEDTLLKLSQKYSIIPICPEVMAGMEVPREPIEYLNDQIINEKGEDLTELFMPVKNELLLKIKKFDIDTAIFKESSPSCGVLKVYDGKFSGNKIDGQGLITEFLRGEGLTVISEDEVGKIL